MHILCISEFIFKFINILWGNFLFRYIFNNQFLIFFIIFENWNWVFQSRSFCSTNSWQNSFNISASLNCSGINGFLFFLIIFLVFYCFFFQGIFKFQIVNTALRADSSEASIIVYNSQNKVWRPKKLVFIVFKSFFLFS